MIARPERTTSARPRVVLAYSDSAEAVRASRQFRRLGWEVHQTSSGPEARRLVLAVRPDLVVLDVDLHEESSWLTCAKLALGGVDCKLILVRGLPTASDQRFAEAAGADAILPRAAVPGVLGARSASQHALTGAAC